MDINKYYVYRHYIEDNTFYVGKGKDDRAYVKKRNKAWDRIVSENNNKYNIEIVKTFINEKEAYKYEKELTEYYKSIGQCEANIMIGKGSLRGKHNGMYGKKHSEQTVQKIKMALKGKNVGRKLSQETKDKIKKTREKNNYKHSDETKLKIKLNHADFRGEKHPMYNKSHTQETKNKIREKNCKYKNIYIIIEEDKLIFENSKTAAKHLSENVILNKTYSAIERSIRDSIRLNKKLYKKYELGYVK